MHGPVPPALPTAPRPPALTRLCVLSFINQGVMFPIYLLGFFASFSLADIDPQELWAMADAIYGKMLDSTELDRLHGFLDLFQEHGTALMGVLALRTAARFIGTLRMWQLKGDGFHIYTTAQLLGILLPMLIAGTAMFSLLGLVLVSLWCLMYFVRMRAIGALGSGLGT